MRQRGFTLVEIMIAVAILASISVVVWGSFNQSFQTKKTVEARLSRYRAARIAMDRIVRDLSMAYLSSNMVPGTEATPRTFFDGIRKTDIDELRFSYMGHQRLYADSKEADTAVVSYLGQRDKENPRKLNLYRRETRRLQADRPENITGETDLLCDDVVRLELSYYHHVQKEWKDTWRTTQADGFANQLPGKVRVKLIIHDDQGQELPLASEVRLAILQPIATGPQDDQFIPGGGGAIPGAGGAGGGAIPGAGQPPLGNPFGGVRGGPPNPFLQRGPIP